MNLCLSRLVLSAAAALVLVGVTPACCQEITPVDAAAAPAARPTPLPPEAVPTFQLRARVTKIGGADPDKKTFGFRFGVGGPTVPTTGSAWSEWLKFDRPLVEATLKGYPAMYMTGYPAVVQLVVGGATDPTLVEAELKLDETGEVTALDGDLMGPHLGILLWREADKKPQAATMTVYNRRYWKTMDGVDIPLGQSPRKFPIADRFIGGDDDRRGWREGLGALARSGMTALMMYGNKQHRALLKEAGVQRTVAAVYNPPGYAFDFEPTITQEFIDKWAKEQAKPYLDAGFSGSDMAMFAMSDEPGWYYPSIFKSLTDNPVSLQRFRDYIKGQGLKPEDVGATSWDTVMPLGRSKAKELPAKRLFYWTTRFFAWDSSRHFARSAKALEAAFGAPVPIFTNFNFFNSRYYVPGPVANNGAKQDPDAAMGGHDWLEFGRMRGSTMLWTEDWFPDSMAYQWSFYAARLGSAARKGNVQWGAYVIPRTAGDRDAGLLQKILAVTGAGAKGLKYFVFGPEYNFPGNCYSEHPGSLPRLTEAHRYIGAAEDVLWPGKRAQAQVAILSPKSAEAWDAKDIAIPNQIEDATNTNLNGKTVDYMAEVADLYLALQHANVPTDFVEEEDLSVTGLKGYKVLYVTEPNVPAELQQGLRDWVQAGGTLVTVSGAAAADRYDEPSRVLSDATGIEERARERQLIAKLEAVTAAGAAKGALGEFMAYGPRGELARPAKDVLASFEGGTPAIVRTNVRRGRVVHFTFMPGLSYRKSTNATADGLPVGFSAVLRNYIAEPVRLAGVTLPATVDAALVETPLLLSDSGAALTTLNWTGVKIAQLKVAVRLPFAARQVESVRYGKLAFEKTRDGVEFVMPLGAADIVKITP